MLQPALRRTRFHLPHHCRGRCARGWPSPLALSFSTNGPATISIARSRSTHPRDGIAGAVRGPPGGAAPRFPRRAVPTGPAADLSRRDFFSTGAGGGAPQPSDSVPAAVLPGGGTAEHTPVRAAEEFGFSSLIRASPNLLCAAPKYFLCFVGNRNCPSLRAIPLRKQFNVQEITHDNQEFYHATFTDPRTKEQFSSGLGGKIHVEKNQANNLGTPLHQGEVKIFEGKVYYREPILAEHAAAARAIDCYMLREESVDTDGYQFCLEAPYKTKEEGLAQEIDYSALLARRNPITANEKTEWAPIIHEKKSSFLDFVRAQPWMLRVPKSFLSNAGNACYGPDYTKLLIYEVQRRIYGKKSFFHATFKDPITQEQFSSGLGGEIHVEKRQGHTPTTPLHQAEVKIFDGKVYYRERKHAEHAAAARAIDCYRLREESADIKHHRLCLEAPYKTIEEGLAQKINYGALLAQRNLVVASERTKRVPVLHEKKSSFSDYVRAKPYMLHTPKSFLNNAGTLCYGRAFSDLSIYEVQRRIYGEEPFFHATFTDPITQEQFSSGLGGEIHVEKRQGHTPTTPLHQAEVKIFDGKVYYWERKHAEHAAAARAIDCYMLREGNQVPHRLCMEEPYHGATERDAQRLDYAMLLRKRNGVQDFREDSRDTRGDGCKSDSRDSSPVNVGEVERLLASQHQFHGEEGSSLPLNERHNYESKKEELRDFQAKQTDLPALTFPFCDAPAPVKNTLSTIGRIAEIWTDTTSADYSSEASQPWSAKSVREEDALSPTAKIEGIRDWYEQINHEPQDSGEIFALAQLCTKTLTALGKANSELHMDGKEASNINVEKDAKRILLKVISLAKSYDHDIAESSGISADVFNAYIQCLPHLDPSRSARTAQHLLKRMENHEKYYGIDLPTPNVRTYNATMALWALEDGVAGQNGVNEVYQRLVGESHLDIAKNDHLAKASSGGGGDRSLLPNNDTFKTLLAVNSKIGTQFSFDQAESWLNKIKQISNSTRGEPFIPDANIYNAALSLLCNKSSAYSTDNTFEKSFLKYGKQYDGGFNDECSNTEAADVAKWLLHAEECGVSPDVEMYEAVIQAWIETGTKEGLLIAEGWAKRAVLSSSPIRLQTFHPIIAAWALCQSERAPDRVREWNEQLSTVGAKPDLTTLSAQIVAWRNAQAGQITRTKGLLKKETTFLSPEETEGDQGNEMQMNVEMAFTAAQNCTQSLEEILRDWKVGGDEGPQDTAALLSMFTHTIQAWGCASRFSLLHPTNSVSLDASHGVSEILKVARIFYSKMYGDESEEYLLSLTGEVYAEIVLQLHQIDSAVDSSSDESNTVSYFCDGIADVERMLRDYEFHSRSHSQSSAFTPDSKAIRFRLYSNILRGCTAVKSPRDAGHVVRLCNLIMVHLIWQNENYHETYGGGGRVEEDDITDIFVDTALLTITAVKNPHERMYVLTAVHNSASPFFARKRKFEASRYATVDRASLIEAMREAMGDSELTEPFLHNFDERPHKRKPRGNTAMSFVHEMISKNRRGGQSSSRN